jgi:hypothetical protein
VILLITDGIPEYSCDATIALATNAASSCFQTGQGFKTYVLGVSANNNNSLAQLHQIAEAGGTQEAYITDSNDVAGSVLAALNAIRAEAIPCDLQIPEPPPNEKLDITKMNLGVCDATGTNIVTPYVESASNCGSSSGWHYDDPSSPSVIHLCPTTCDTVTIPGASLYYSLGCATQTVVR